MHSRIFGIITKEEYEEYIECNGELEMPKWQFEENLPPEMDYVDGDVNFEEDCQWLIKCLKQNSNKLEYDENTHVIKFLSGFKEEYFKKKWDTLHSFIHQPDAFDQFCKNTMLPFRMSETINDRYSFYQCDENGGYETFDNFVRYLDTNKEYVIFGSLDYHY